MNTNPPTTEQNVAKTGVLSLGWAFGLNHSIPGGVHTLNDGIRKIVFYAAAHTGILFDYSTGKQHTLQGHINTITSTAVTQDRRWVATADSGENSTLIVWDTMPYITNKNASTVEMATAISTWNITKVLPVKTLFDPHNGAGVVGMAFSEDGKYLVTLGADSPQTISVWDWSSEVDTPIAITVITGSKQVAVQVNPEDPMEIVSTGPQGVLFFTWDLKGNMEQHIPFLTAKGENKLPAGFSVSAFIPTTSTVITGTHEGDLLIWADKSLNNLSENLPKGQKAAVKFVKAHNAPITFVTTVNNKYVVTGGEDGYIKIFDFQLRLVFWIERIKAGPITSISFGNPMKYEGEQTTYIIDGVQVPEFVICTSHAKSILITRNKDSKNLTSNNIALPSMKILLQGHYGNINSFVLHPKKQRFVTGCDNGIVQVWDYQKKHVIQSRRFDLVTEVRHVENIDDVKSGTSNRGQSGKSVTHVEPLAIKAMTYSPDTNVLALGFHTGAVQFVDSETLEDIPNCNWNVAKTSISLLKFSTDGMYMAVGDTDYSINVYKKTIIPPKQLSPENAPKSVQEVTANKPTESWSFLGKYKAHFKPIVDLLFLAPTGSKTEYLYSISQDRHIFCFDLASSSVTAGLIIHKSRKIDQLAIPMGIAEYGVHHGRQLLVVPNSEFKFKLFDADTLECVKVTLGPVYGGVVTSLKNMPSGDKNQETKYMVFQTDEKIIGVTKLPLDGNAHKSMGLIAHPGQIKTIIPTTDGKALLTCGITDGIVNLWTFHPSVLEAQVQLGGEGYEPFLRMLDPEGTGSKSYREIEDYFYYAQLRDQGEDTKNNRIIKDTLPLTQIGPIMQAIGYYFSESEYEELMNEIRFSSSENKSAAPTGVTLHEFIKLYINHRPVSDPTMEEISQLLATAASLSNNGGENVQVTKQQLESFLEQFGEKMSTEEFESTLKRLVQINAGPHANANGEASKGMKDGDLVSVKEFVEKVLGFQEASSIVPPASD